MQKNPVECSDEHLEVEYNRLIVNPVVREAVIAIKLYLEIERRRDERFRIERELVEYNNRENT